MSRITSKKRLSTFFIYHVLLEQLRCANYYAVYNIICSIKTETLKIRSRVLKRDVCRHIYIYHIYLNYIHELHHLVIRARYVNTTTANKHKIIQPLHTLNTVYIHDWVVKSVRDIKYPIEAAPLKSR